MIIRRWGQLKIRPVRPWDIQPMQSLYEKSLRENSAGFVQDPAFRGDMDNFIKSCEAKNGDVFVAYQGGKLVGFAGLKGVSDTEVELCKLHVNSQFHGKGFGAQLCRNILEHAVQRGFKSVQLHVTATQTAAIRLYEKMGFLLTDREISKVTINQQEFQFDTLYMSLALPEELPSTAKAKPTYQRIAQEFAPVV